MPNPLADEARALNDRQLGEAINEAYRELFNLQFQKGTRQLQDGLAVPRARRQIARLRTIQREREIAEVLGAPIEPTAAPADVEISPQKRRALEERAALDDEEAVDEAVAEPDAEPDVEPDAEPDVETEADDDGPRDETAEDTAEDTAEAADDADEPAEDEDSAERDEKAE